MLKPKVEVREEAGVLVAEYRPEADATPIQFDVAFDRGPGVVPFRLEDGETVLGGDTDVGFQHPSSLPRISSLIQPPNT